MDSIDYRTHKRVRLEYLPDFQQEYGCWGRGETLDELIEYFTKLNEAAKKAGVVKTMVDVYTGDGDIDISGWIPKTPEELELDRIANERIDNTLRERELKELARLKEKYDGQTRT
jgi:hypothetical protein